MTRIPIILILAVTLLTSCHTTRTIEVPVEVERVKVVRDTLRTVDIRRDSIHVADTIVLAPMPWMSGEGSASASPVQTLQPIYRSHIEYRDRLVRDTLYITRTDTLSVAKPVYLTKTETRRGDLWWWQKILLWIGAAAIACAALWLTQKLKKT